MKILKKNIRRHKMQIMYSAIMKCDILKQYDKIKC